MLIFVLIFAIGSGGFLYVRKRRRRLVRETVAAATQTY